MSSLREKLVFVFQEFLASVSKVFILAGRQGTRLSFYEDFGILWQLLHNNRASFHLW